MSLKVEIVTPDRRAYEGEADGVTLPTSLGEVGILTGHIPLTAIISAGEITITRAGQITRLAVDKGFMRVVANKVSVVTEAAIDVAKIDLDALDKAESRARDAIAEAKGSKDPDPEGLLRLEQALRYAAIQRMAKGRSANTAN